MTELSRHILQQVEEAAAGAEYLHVGVEEESNRIDEIDLKLSFLLQQMLDSTINTDNRSRTSLAKRIRPLLDEIEYGFYGRTTDPMPRMEDKAGVGITPIGDDGKALLSINLHASTWKDFDDEQSRFLLSERMWVVLEGLDVHYRKLNREGKFVSVKDIDHYQENLGA